MARLAAAVEGLFNVYLEMSTKQQDEIKSMLEWNRKQIGASIFSLRFLDITTQTLSKTQFAIFKNLVIQGSELESAEQSRARVRRQKRKQN
jgi:hypothetical protein